MFCFVFKSNPLLWFLIRIPSPGPIWSLWPIPDHQPLEHGVRLQSNTRECKSTARTKMDWREDVLEVIFWKRKHTELTHDTKPQCDLFVSCKPSYSNGEHHFCLNPDTCVLLQQQLAGREAKILYKNYRYIFFLSLKALVPNCPSLTYLGVCPSELSRAYICIHTERKGSTPLSWAGKQEMLVVFLKLMCQRFNFLHPSIRKKLGRPHMSNAF